ncbi:hypothetical protein GF362_04185 [Candidatus Dojkabacteria bacterium]|nr:hypothetical protein [Candidatus Dojkabacteria bacterium]
MNKNKKTKIEDQLKNLSRKPDVNWQKKALNELLVEINSSQSNGQERKIYRFWKFLFQTKQIAFLTMMFSFLVIASIIFFPLTKSEDKPIFDKFIDTFDGIDEDLEKDELQTKPVQNPTEEDVIKEEEITSIPNKEPTQTPETKNIILSPTLKPLPTTDEEQISATPEPTYPALDGGGELTAENIEICILNENNKEETITIESIELEKYLDKGATRGACPTPTPTECFETNNCE